MRRALQWSMAALFAFSLQAFAADSRIHTFTSAVDAERYTRLTNEVRCVVCQNQSLADSNAPLANDLRMKIYTLIEQKKSDEEINDYLVKRYGEFILLRPRVNKLTYFLWAFPFIAILTALTAFIQFFRHAGGARRPANHEPIS